MKRAHIMGSLDVTLAEAQEKRNEAHRLCLEAKKLAPQWRKSHLQGLADALAEFHQQLPAQVLKNLRHRETIRRKAQRVKALSKNQKEPKYTSLFHTVDGNRIECSDKVSMEKACTAESLLRYTRCHSSPFYEEPLLSALGVLADTEAAEQILQGTFEIPPELDPHTKAIIGLLQRPPPTKCLDITAFHLTADKIAKAWKRRRPNTQGEPAGLSFPHHIVGVYHPIIAEVDVALHSAPLEVGFAPACWLTMTDVELLKKPGVFDVELMRTIQLMNTF